MSRFPWSSWMLQAKGARPDFSFPSCGSVLGDRSGLQYSQVSRLQPKPSECCVAPTVHVCQAGAFNLPHCVTLCLVWRCIKWEQLAPLLPLCCSGHCTLEFLKQRLRVFFWANSLWLGQDSPTFWPVLRLFGPAFVAVQLFSHLQVSPDSPISLILSQPTITVPAGEYHLCVFPTVSLSFPVTWSIQVTPGVGLTSLLWEGRELWSYNRWSGSPPKFLQQLPSLVPGQRPQQSWPWPGSLGLTYCS